MLFNVTPVNTALSRIEEIPDAFFANITAHQVFSYHLLPHWFQAEYGNLKARGLYKKAQDFFIAIKASNRENDIIIGYNNYKTISIHCTDLTSPLFYLEDINADVFEKGKVFFDGLFKSLDSSWLTKFTSTNVHQYLADFKTQNKVYLCAVCGNEKIVSNRYEARGALDHWLCKAKYPLASVNWSNLIPLGEGCNRPPVKGEKEIVWTDNERNIRQTFLYPYSFQGDVDISLNCIIEPSNGIADFGEWEFQFTGQNLQHQDLLNKWNVFFNINYRWVEETLKEFIETWTDLFSSYIIAEGITEIDNHYDKALKSYRNTTNGFNLIPSARVHRFFLDFLINDASKPLYNAYKTEVIKLSTI
jgi:hypothetical protein